MRPLVHLLLVLWLLLASFTTAAQRVLRFKPHIDGRELRPDSCYFLAYKNDKVCLSTFKFYISGLTMKSDRDRIFNEKNSFHLLNIQDTASLLIALPLPAGQHPSTLHFLLGIDSMTNSEGVKGACLDPVQGMYWTWLSGYIHLKLEGRYGSGGTSFQYHLGGYRYPYNTVQEISISVPDADTLLIPVDVGKFLQLAGQGFPERIMSPGSDAMNMSKLAVTMFPFSAK